MIDIKRRTIVAMLGGIAAKPSYALSLLRECIDVDLSISDEQGKPVPFATVWGYVLPRDNPLAIDGEDLWRLTTRYQSSFEFASPVNRPVPCLRVYPMADAEGHTKPVIDYRYLEGSESRRPPSMRIGLTVMKRGYLPARIDCVVKDESRLTVKLALQRDRNQAVETQPYLRAFERLRYELSDPKHNENISASTHERIEMLRTGLETAAQQAIAASDNVAAARILARMQYLPAIRMNGGKPIGFSQADPYAERSWAYVVEAYRLDPRNPYIAAEYLFRRGSEEFGGMKYVPEQATEGRKQAFAAYLSQLHTLMRASAPEIWPTFHTLYARWHRKSDDPRERARMLPLLEESYQFEPKFQAKERLISNVERPLSKIHPAA